MARKSVGKRAAVRSEEPGDGMVGVLVDRVFENPAASGGLMVMALTASAIITNALFLQSSRHPDPFFHTRPAIVHTAPQPAPLAAMSPAPTPLREEIADMTPPMPRLAPRHHGVAAAEPVADAPMPPMPVEPAPRQPAAESAASVELVSGIQRELARLGLYRDTIDGVVGAHTEAAILAYETAAGLQPSGRATPELLALMGRPLPAPGQPVVADPARDAEAAALDLRERQRAEKIAAEKAAVAATQAHANARIVQAALNRIGYGPLSVDGMVNEETIDAIRRFELDNGLPITGKPSDALIARLVAIGAVKPG